MIQKTFTISMLVALLSLSSAVFCTGKTSSALVAQHKNETHAVVPAVCNDQMDSLYARAYKYISERATPTYAAATAAGVALASFILIKTVTLGMHKYDRYQKMRAIDMESAAQHAILDAFSAAVLTALEVNKKVIAGTPTK